jgi:hypothetical protein
VKGNIGYPLQHRSNTKRKNKNKRKNDKNRITDSAKDELPDNDPETVKRQKTREKLEKEMTNTIGEEETLSESRRMAVDNLLTPNDTIPTNKSAPSGSGQDREGGVYEEYTDGVLDMLPWMEGDGRSLEDLVHDLLLTNPRYSNNVKSIVDKLKDKTILLDNPDKKKKSARKRNLKPIGVAPAGRKELQSMGALNVKNMGLKCVIFEYEYEF